VDATSAIEEKIPPILKYNCLLDKLKKCMERSEVVKRTVDPLALENVCGICKRAGDIAEPSNLSICAMREMIVTIHKAQQSFNPKLNQTIFLYLERIIYLLQVLLLLSYDIFR